MDNYLMDATCNSDLLNKMPGWAITTVALLGAAGMVLCRGTEFVKEVKPLIQPFIGKWQNGQMDKTVIDQDCYSEVEVGPALSVN